MLHIHQSRTERRGSKIFPTFVKLLPATGDEEQELKSQLLRELNSLSSHLQSSGPFLKGARVSAGDMSLGPKLYHVLTALKYFKARCPRAGWFPDILAP